MGNQRGTLRLFAGMAFITALAVDVGATAPEQRARDWVQNHRAALPRTLEELSGFPPIVRREIIKALDPETLSTFYREQIRQFMAQTQGLTDAQRAVLEKTSAALTPAFFAAGNNGPWLCPPSELGITFANGPSLKWLALSNLGTISKPRRSWRTAMLAFELVAARALAVSAVTVDCECYPDLCSSYEDCPPWYESCFGSRACDINLDDCIYGCGNDKCKERMCVDEPLLH